MILLYFQNFSRCFVCSKHRQHSVCTALPKAFIAVRKLIFCLDSARYLYASAVILSRNDKKPQFFLLWMKFGQNAWFCINWIMTIVSQYMIQSATTDGGGGGGWPKVGNGGRGYSTGIWVGGFGLLNETLTLFKTKRCNFCYPLRLVLFHTLFKTGPSTTVFKNVKLCTLFKTMKMIPMGRTSLCRKYMGLLPPGGSLPHHSLSMLCHPREFYCDCWLFDPLFIQKWYFQSICWLQWRNSNHKDEL